MKYFFSGLLMGAADLIPGISGGTVAFLLGIYEELIETLSSIGVDFFEKQQKKGFPLFFLLTGMGTSLLLFSRVVHFLLSAYREPFFAAFCGLILASAFFCMKEIGRIRWLPLLLALGAALSLPEPSLREVSHHPLTLLFAGYCSISAMLLPGISGSYVLHLFQAYEPAIAALATLFITPLKSLKLLSFLGVGILTGAVTFTKAIRALLTKWHDTTLSVLSGFMIGSVKMILPEALGVHSALFCLLGIVLVVSLKRWAAPLKTAA